MANTNEYTDLIAGYHRDKPKYTEWVYQLTQPLLTARKRLAALVEAFDVDKAVGAQLDAVGQRVGVSRALPETIQGTFFGYDDVDSVGFDLGIWKRPYQSTVTYKDMDDATYRIVIKSKILQNHWNGTNETRRKFIDALESALGLTSGSIYIMDMMDMTVTIMLQEDEIPETVLQLLKKRIIDFIPAGVGVTFRDYSPYFGLDLMNTGVQGLDTSTWQIEE